MTGQLFTIALLLITGSSILFGLFFIVLGMKGLTS